MRVFLAGIMQGSHLGNLVHDQGYREALRRLLVAHWPKAEVYDPFARHATSVDYGLDQARTVFEGHVEMCRRADLVVAFVPEASMGTGIEMWEAARHGRAVVAITPLVHNWVVLLTARAIYPDREAFAAALAAGDIDRLLTAY